MNTRTCVTLSLLALLAACGCSTAPLQLSLWNPIQIVDETEDVHGVRLNALYTENKDVVGLDLGLGMNFCNDMTGVQGAGIAIAFFGDMTGVQIGGLLASSGGWGADTTGVQIGGLLASSGDMTGVQVGGLFNECKGDVTGVQLAGLLSDSEEATGLQIALINRTKRLKGVQIGLINIVDDQWLPFVPFINFSFGGSDDAEQQQPPKAPVNSELGDTKK